MVVHPNKPVMFAVVHDDAEVDKALPNFLTAIKGKKRLFIELGYYGGQSLKGTDFYRLAMAASKANLQVIPLDQVTQHEARVDIFKHHANLSDGAYRYQNIDKREIKWERLLRGATSNDIIVMHPEHAKRMVEVLSIPKTNIAYFGESDHATYAGERKLATNERARIEAQRIARRLRLAKEKSKNPRPFFKSRKS